MENSCCYTAEHLTIAKFQYRFTNGLVTAAVASTVPVRIRFGAFFLCARSKWQTQVKLVFLRDCTERAEAGCIACTTDVKRMKRMSRQQL